MMSFLLGLGILLCACAVTGTVAGGALLVATGHYFLAVPVFLPMVLFLGFICYAMGEDLRG